jgi:glycerophosphoryl diester phosphodiesterase
MSECACSIFEYYQLDSCVAGWTKVSLALDYSMANTILHLMLLQVSIMSGFVYASRRGRSDDDAAAEKDTSCFGRIRLQWRRIRRSVSTSPAVDFVYPALVVLTVGTQVGTTVYLLGSKQVSDAALASRQAVGVVATAGLVAIVATNWLSDSFGRAYVWRTALRPGRLASTLLILIGAFFLILYQSLVARIQRQADRPFEEPSERTARSLAIVYTLGLVTLAVGCVRFTWRSMHLLHAIRARNHPRPPRSQLYIPPDALAAPFLASNFVMYAIFSLLVMAGAVCPYIVSLGIEIFLTGVLQFVTMATLIVRHMLRSFPPAPGTRLPVSATVLEKAPTLSLPPHHKALVRAFALLYTLSLFLAIALPIIDVELVGWTPLIITLGVLAGWRPYNSSGRRTLTPYLLTGLFLVLAWLITTSSRHSIFYLPSVLPSIIALIAVYWSHARYREPPLRVRLALLLGERGGERETGQSVSAATRLALALEESLPTLRLIVAIGLTFGTLMFLSLGLGLALTIAIALYQSATVVMAGGKVVEARRAGVDRTIAGPSTVASLGARHAVLDDIPQLELRTKGERERERDGGGEGEGDGGGVSVEMVEGGEAGNVEVDGDGDDELVVQAVEAVESPGDGQTVVSDSSDPPPSSSPPLSRGCCGRLRWPTVLRSIAIGCSGVLTVFILLGASQAFFQAVRDAGRNPRPVIFGHRGAVVDDIPECSLAAIRYAAASGAHGVEVDVRLTADGELVVFHDATIERTVVATGDGVPTSGNLADFTYAQVATFDLGGGERVPTLREVLAEAVNLGIALDIEFKPGEWEVAELFEETWAMVEEFNYTQHVLIESLDVQYLVAAARRDVLSIAAARTFASQFYPTLANVGYLVLPAEAVFLNPWLILFAHSYDQFLFVYFLSVENRALIKALARLGVDGFQLNDPALGFPKDCVRGGWGEDVPCTPGEGEGE